ncbi:MAG TPA: hypothetical protein DCX22_04340 [Dehalococcoidia bacterium]|nr:hypothetical protein [Dehalococcoidia bacterium]
MAVQKRNAPKKTTIMDKARKIFSEQGYAKTTMKDIGRVCRCKASNIYNYFPSKESLLNEILRDEMNQLLIPLRYLATDVNTDPAEQMAIMIRHHLNVVLGTRRLTKQIFEGEFKYLRAQDKKKIIELRDEFQKIMETIIQRGIDQGIFVPVDVKMTCFLIASMTIRTRTWYRARGRLSAEQIANEIIRMAMHGIKKCS